MLNVPPNRNFGDAIAVQDLRGILEIFSDVFPRTKILAPPLRSPQILWSRKPNAETPFLILHYYLRMSNQITLYKDNLYLQANERENEMQLERARVTINAQ